MSSILVGEYWYKWCRCQLFFHQEISTQPHDPITTSNTANLPCTMKINATFTLFLLLAVAATLFESGSAQRCRFVSSGGRRRRGQCVPAFVCKGRPFRTGVRPCPGGTGCCNKSQFRCRGRGFAVPRQFCRPGNDLGRFRADAPAFIRCCRNGIPR